MVLHKNDLLEYKDSEHRALIKRLEDLQEELGQTQSSWIKVYLNIFGDLVHE